jgi:hypothetical protein
MASKTNWYGSIVRKLHLDYHEPPWMSNVAKAMTPDSARRQARMFREAGIEAVEVFAHDHHGLCFFPTKCGFAHPSLAQDYTGHMAAALREEGIRTIAYMNVFTNVLLKDKHPDWVVTAPDGSRPSGAWLQFEGSHMCASSPYLQEYFLPLLREVIERFDFDAIWLDAGSWMVETLCACAYCQKQFLAATGYELPTSHPIQPTHSTDVMMWSAGGSLQVQQWSIHDDGNEDETYVAWRIWRRGQIQTYLNAVTTAARAVKPAILIGDNSAGRWSTPHPLTENGRFIRWLTPKEMGIDFLSCDPVPYGGNHEIILSREGRYQTTTGLPFDYMNERFHKWGEWQLRSTIDFKLEFATLLATGSMCFFADQPYPDGSLEPAVYERLREAYDFVARREAYVKGAEMVPDVAILASAPSQLFGPRGNGRDAGRRSGMVGGDPNAGSRTDRVSGAHLAAGELGIHCLLYDDPTLRERIAEQTMVVVAEQCLMEDTTIDALASFVEDGGGLLVTGRSGRWDEQYRKRDHSRLYDLLGVEVENDLPSPIHYMRLHDAFHQGTELPDMPLQCWGAAVRVRTAGAETLADLIGPRPEVWRDGVQDEEHWQHYTTVGACPPGRDVLGPAITSHKLGKGRALYVAVDPFAVYAHEGHGMMRLMLDRLLELTTPSHSRRISAEKPLHVELSLQRQGERLIVHLVNYFAQKRSTVLVHNEDVPPVRDVVVRIRTDSEPRRVVAQPDGNELTWEYTNGITTVNVPKLYLHTMVVID